MTSVGTFPSSRLSPGANSTFSELSVSHGADSGDALRLLFDGLEDAAILLQDELITYANPAADNLLHTHKSTINGKHLTSFLDEIEHRELYSYLRAATVEGNSLKQKGEIRLKDLSIPVKIQCLPVRGSQGTHILFIRGGRDIQTESGIQSQLSLAELPCGVLRLDRDLRYLYGNRELTQMSAIFSFAEAGKTAADLYWPASLRRSLEQVMAELSCSRQSHRCRLSFGSDLAEIEWWATVIPHCDSKGQLASATFLFDAKPASTSRQSDDESPENLLQHERTKCEEAVAASRARDAFFGWVSHELRTPMNGIQSWAHILETYVNASSSSPLAQRALSGIRHGIAQQLHLVDELLDVSRIMEGKLSLSKQGFFLRPVLQEAMENVQAAALANDIHLACHYALYKEKINGDPCRVQQMVRLLLTRLITESVHGSTIHLHVESQDQQVLIRLRSSGSPHVPPHNAYKKGKPARMTKPAKVCRKDVDAFLVRRLAELQGGRLDYVYKDGSALPVITLTLPLHIPARRRVTPN